MTVTEQMTQLAKQAKAASRELSRLATSDKNACLLAMAETGSVPHNPIFW